MKLTVGLSSLNKAPLLAFDRHMVELVRRDPDIVLERAKTTSRRYIELANEQGLLLLPQEEGVEWTEEEREWLKEFDIPVSSDLISNSSRLHQYLQAHPKKRLSHYRRLSKIFHPDKKTGSHDKQVLINAVNEKLKAIEEGRVLSNVIYTPSPSAHTINSHDRALIVHPATSSAVEKRERALSFHTQKREVRAREHSYFESAPSSLSHFQTKDRKYPDHYFLNKTHFCFPEDNPALKNAEWGMEQAWNTLYDTGEAIWSWTKRWSYENPKKAMVIGVITAWKIKKWLFTEVWDPLKEAANYHKKPPYKGWPDRKSGDWRSLSTFPLFFGSQMGGGSGLVGPLLFRPTDPSHELKESLSSLRGPTTPSLVLESKAKEKVPDEPTGVVERREEGVINTAYEYEDQDVNALLILRAQEARLNRDTTVIMAPLHNVYYQIERHLREERERHAQTFRAGGPLAPRTILLPLNLINDHHWVGLVIRLDGRNQVTEIVYIDSLGEGIPTSVREALQAVYGASIRIVIKKGLLQPDETSCGPCMVENLVLEARNQLEESRINPRGIQRVRQHHRVIADRYFPRIRFGERQRRGEQSVQRGIVYMTTISDLWKLSKIQRENLLRLLYPVGEAFMPSFPMGGLRKKLYPDDAMRTKILIYGNKERHIVGYNFLKFARKKVKDRSYVVIRPMAFLMGKYRGGSSTFSFSFLESLKYFSTHFRERIVFCDPMTPYSYHLASKFMGELYPSYKYPVIPREISEIAELVIREENREIDHESSNPFVLKIPADFRMTRSELVRFRSRLDPSIRYYNEATGLSTRRLIFTIIPLTGKNMFFSGVRFFVYRVKALQGKVK